MTLRPKVISLGHPDLDEHEQKILALFRALWQLLRHIPTSEEEVVFNAIIIALQKVDKHLPRSKNPSFPEKHLHNIKDIICNWLGVLKN